MVADRYMKKPVYKIRSRVWLYPGVTSWHFVTVNKKLSGEIRSVFGEAARGWGSLPVEVFIGKTRWRTSIFPDKETKTYLLPIKAEVRKRENIGAGELCVITFEVLV